ncbi:MAG TPA: hypothetical protein VK524_24055, partial [Polyangiaceae bacterium]|nr:hypothetical protein [Polyangiaceae bacterium]
PAPFNIVPTGPAISNYSIAISTSTTRAWWMSTRAGRPELLTAALDVTNAVPDVVNIPLGQTTCTRIGGDATPWAAPDGTFLLFSALEQNASCLATGLARDLYIAIVQQSGQVVAPAILLGDVSRTGVDDTDPAMSADLCWMYFSSNPNGAASGFRLFAAQRQ